MSFFKKLWLNLKPIKNLTFIISSSFFSAITIIFSFISWDDIGIINTWIKLGILLAIIIFSLFTALLF